MMSGNNVIVGKKQRRRKTQRHRKILTMGICGCLAMGLLCGCSEEKVDYGLNTEEDGGGAFGSLEQFADAQQWEDDWKVPMEGSSELDMTVRAKVTVPDVGAMSVVEVEEIVTDQEWRKQFLNSFYGGNPVYYHDKEHYTSGELEELIQNEQNQISALKDPDYDGVSEDQKELVIESLREEITRWESFLSNASEEYTEAEDFDSCDTYLGYVDELPCEVIFRVNDEGSVLEIDAHPHYSAVFGPETSFDYVEAYRSSAGNAPSSGEQTCEISREEARTLADNFLVQTGRASQVCFAEEDTHWVRVAADEAGLVTESETVIYGYSFSYSTGADGVSFAQFGGIRDHDLFWDDGSLVDFFDSNDTTTITVTDEGIVSVSMQYPITVNTVSRQTELLPLDTIQRIMKDEVMNNSAEYDFVMHPRFNSLDLIYFRVKDDSREGSYSYVPAWRLSAKDQDTYYHPVLVNAIDGSVIHIKDEL